MSTYQIAQVMAMLHNINTGVTIMTGCAVSIALTNIFLLFKSK